MRQTFLGKTNFFSLTQNLPADNFNLNNKNVIPTKYILAFDIGRIKTRYVKRLK